MKKRLLPLITLGILLISCAQKGKQASTPLNRMQLMVDTVHIPSSDVLNLKSYYLSACFQTDSSSYLYGYNYKMHALDIIDLLKRTMSQITLHKDGPNAIGRHMQSLLIHTPDSIWIYDNAQRLVLINDSGVIMRSVDLKKELKSKEMIQIDQNYAMSTSRFCYDNKRRSLLYGIEDGTTSPVSFKVRETFLDGITKSIDYALQPSALLSDIKRYGDMGEVNISFANEEIIYNYPPESTVYTLNRTTGERRVVQAASAYTENVAAECATKEIDIWTVHRLENIHFYDVMYLPHLNLYARLHVNGVKRNATRDWGALFSSKKLYLMLFDANFAPLGEYQLSPKRYDYSMGWGVTSNSLYLFVNNPLDEVAQGSEELTIDVISLKQPTNKTPK
ncbi:MAG: DUF4221 domain-containing protein [Prevotellaceae bacterium]|jgi:hypothetical protein|nr:DUF4221 domain-containing protein [Prevotellaceae bacterium]